VNSIGEALSPVHSQKSLSAQQTGKRRFSSRVTVFFGIQNQETRQSSAHQSRTGISEIFSSSQVLVEWGQQVHSVFSTRV